MLQPRIMKRADAVLTAGHACRPEKSGKMKTQGISSPLTLRLLTAVAIDAFAKTILGSSGFAVGGL
jgi:hypothetical protein